MDMRRLLPPGGVHQSRSSLRFSLLLTAHKTFRVGEYVPLTFTAPAVRRVCPFMLRALHYALSKAHRQVLLTRTAAGGALKTFTLKQLTTFST